MANFSQDSITAHFTATANQYDSRPYMTEMAHAAAAAILKADVLRPTFHCLDLGCGTGLTSLQLADHVASICGIDPSQGMLDAFEAKIAARGLKDRISVICMELSKENDPLLKGDHFDAIFSHLVLHHVLDIPALLKVARTYLKPGGVLIISDFQKTDWSWRFHPREKNDYTPHINGIDRDWMREKFINAGFERVTVDSVFSVPQEAESIEVGGPKEVKEFPMLLAIGYRNAMS
mmetsp:Transcript_17411/g.28599  ORF Transcript_17411/g.28599 Transcript_17411/m.28599 type:complete len:234 (-) Transcript_17411:261-962(-)|eukprot:CAMPEP_0184659848 /NCGR_PEP_ID=MMETSP0308-20130426/31347_1 /TAXON_ID=38269 /ORGANISM="Gloeochaete witrockiana, Strain SAG 46.84" /LENGTH=233 /DNA_ID=CAMNT_0027099977 /DNA_START=81 /DNA_END=782 /DNA_ORIENTATION=+